MAVIAQQITSRTPIDLPSAAQAAAAGDKIANDGSQLLYIENTSGGSITLTVAVTQTVDGVAAANRTFTIANNERKLIGPWPVGTYNDTNQQVGLSYSATTGVKVLAIKPGS